MAQRWPAIRTIRASAPIMEFRVVSSVPSVDAPGQTLTIANSCGTNDKSQVPPTSDAANPDRRAGAHEAHRVRPVGRRRLARPGHRASAPPTAPRTAVVPVDHQGQRRGRAHLQRQPHLDARSEAGRDRALDLRQRRRRMGPPDPSALRGRRHHEPRGAPIPADRAPCPQGRLAAAPVGAVRSRCSSANMAAPTSTTATTPCTRTSPC